MWWDTEQAATATRKLLLKQHTVEPLCESRDSRDYMFPVVSVTRKKEISEYFTNTLEKNLSNIEDEQI